MTIADAMQSIQGIVNSAVGEPVTYTGAPFTVETKYLKPSDVPEYLPEASRNAMASGGRSFVFLTADIQSGGKALPGAGAIITHYGVGWRVSDVTHSDGARHRVVCYRVAPDVPAVTNDPQTALYGTPPTRP